MRIKPGVDLRDLTPQALLAIQVADAVFRRFGLEGTVTSVRRYGAATGQGLHAEGRAFDLRAPRRCDRLEDGLPSWWPFRPSQPTGAALDTAVTLALKEALGGSKVGGGQYDVVLEVFKLTPDNDHLHVEWDPRPRV